MKREVAQSVQVIFNFEKYGCYQNMRITHYQLKTTIEDIYKTH